MTAAAALALAAALLVASDAAPAPRPSAVAIPAAARQARQALPSAASSGNPQRRTGRPEHRPRPPAVVAPSARRPAAALAPASVPGSIRGVASWMPARFGPRYLALPQGPGVRVRVCGPGGCLDMLSTDAGPDLAMQRAPFHRVADLGAAAWLRVCGLPLARGLCAVTVTNALTGAV